MPPPKLKIFFSSLLVVMLLLNCLFCLSRPDLDPAMPAADREAYAADTPHSDNKVKNRRRKNPMTGRMGCRRQEDQKQIPTGKSRECLSQHTVSHCVRDRLHLRDVSALWTSHWLYEYERTG